MYSNEIIKELINCEKQIVDPPPKAFKEDRGQLKKNFTLQSVDGKYNFNVFIRCSIHFKENFSIGMDYNPKEERGTLCIIRCNGAHGESNIYPHHAKFHVHKANADTINKGLKPESNIEETTEYASFEEAIQFFLNEVNINFSDRNHYFPKPDSQTKIEFNDE